MSSSNQSPEQRQHIRYRLKENIFVAIHGHYFDSLANVADLNRRGIGFYSESGERGLAGKVLVLDLISDSNHAIIRSLSARVVFGYETTQHENDPAESSKRYGLKFVNLSTLEKRQLDLITKKYALTEYM